MTRGYQRRRSADIRGRATGLKQSRRPMQRHPHAARRLARTTKSLPRQSLHDLDRTSARSNGQKDPRWTVFEIPSTRGSHLARRPPLVGDSAQRRCLRRVSWLAGEPLRRPATRGRVPVFSGGDERRPPEARRPAEAGSKGDFRFIEGAQEEDKVSRS